MLGVDAAGLGAELEGGDGGGVVDEDGQLGEHPRRLDEEGPLLLLQLAQPEPLGVDAGLGGDQPLHHLLGGHLQAEDGDVLAQPGGVAGKGEAEGSLPHTGPGRHDDQVRLLQPSQQPIQVHEPRGHPQRLPPVVVEVLDAVVVGADDLLDGGQVAGDAALGDTEEGLLRPVHHLVDVLLLPVGQLGDVAGGVDEAAADGGLLDDTAVGLHVDGGGDGVDELGDVGRAARLVQKPPCLQLVAQGHEVHRLPPLVEGQDGLVDPAVLLDVEIFRAEEGSHTKEGLRVDQEGPQHRLFRLYVMGYCLFRRIHRILTTETRRARSF